jgi:YfiH family protein
VQIIRSEILSRYTEILHGVSTMNFSDPEDSFGFNLSFTVGDNYERALKNREKFFNALGTDYSRAAYQEQIHSDIIKIVTHPGNQGKSDAMITARKNIVLAISIADCTPILIYDSRDKIIAGVHSGWRGTHKRILEKTIRKMIEEFGSDPQYIIAYLGPSICQKHYEVGKEVAEKFSQEFVIRKEGKFFLDVAGVNVKILLENGVPEKNIEKSELCTFEAKGLLHSYRRDKENSGRGFAVIMMKGGND